MPKQPDEVPVDEKATWLKKLTEEPYDLDYWLSKTPLERLEAGELLRQHVYGYDSATARMERIIQVIRDPWGRSGGVHMSNGDEDQKECR